MNTFALRPLSIFAMPVRRQLSNRATVKTEPTAFSTIFTKVTNQPTVKVRDGRSFKPTLFSLEAILAADSEICRLVSEAMGNHGIIALSLSESQRELMWKLRQTNEALSTLPDIVLKNHHFGGNKRTKQAFFLPDGTKVPAGTKLPRVGWLPFEDPVQSRSLEAINPSEMSDSPKTGIASDNPILEQVFLPRLFGGGAASIIPPNWGNPSLNFKAIWLESMGFLEGVANAVMQSLRKANGWSTEILSPLLEQPTSSLPTDSFRLIRLPSTAADQLPLINNGQVFKRFAGHNDRSSLVTVLPQASLPGLQVALTGKQEMVDVKSPDKTQPLIYVIAGNFLNRFTKGQYKPSFHRVVGTRAEVQQPRYSEGYFKGPSSDAPWHILNGTNELLTLPEDAGGRSITKGSIFQAYKGLPRRNSKTEQLNQPLTDEWIYSTYPAAVAHRLQEIAKHQQALVAKYGQSS